MHDLIPLDLALPGALTTAEIDATMAYAEAEKALATREAYASDWRDFAAWCALQGRHSPASARGHRRRLPLQPRRQRPQGQHHRPQGRRHRLPPQDGRPRATDQQRGREGRPARHPPDHRRAKQGKAPATADLIGQMIALCPDNMIGKRDRALLCLGFAGAFRRSELCALEVADLTEVPDGLRILIRRSKGDQEGQGQEVAIPRGYKLRPVEAVQTWLAAAEISNGPVFRAVTRGGRVSCEAMVDDSAARIVKRYARRVGLDPASYAGHSLRSGFLTSAAESGASIWKLSEVSRTQKPGHVARLCAAGRSVQGTCRSGVPMTGI